MRTIFVFGSNLAGRHGKGAALYARQHHGAVYGQGEGIQGDSYAIPTKDARLRTLPLDAIQQYVETFLAFARESNATFEVTRIGCGLAGYTDAQIAPMFAEAPANCILPEGWRATMNTDTDETAQHAVYAPSSAHRWTVCTASALGIATLGEQEEGEEAAEGTRAHDEIERCFSEGERRGVSPVMMLNLDHPAAYGIALLMRYVAGLAPGQLWIEQRVRLTDQIWGRCDVAHWHAESATLTIVDYKNGFVGVDAEENEQLRIYAAGSIYTHNLPAKWIRLVVVQPNDFRPVPKVKQWTESAESLFAFATRTAAIPHGKLTFVAGEHCTYCPLFGRCEASKDVLVRLSVILANPPDAVPPSQFAMFKACQKPVADWFAAMDKAQLKQALAGTVPPGMKVVTGTKHRAWKDEAAARREIVNVLSEAALELPSPAEAEKLGMDKAEVAALAYTPDGGPVLAFASDKRKPFVAKSSAEMFRDIPGVTK